MGEHRFPVLVCINLRYGELAVGRVGEDALLEPVVDALPLGELGPRALGHSREARVVGGEVQGARAVGDPRQAPRIDFPTRLHSRRSSLPLRGTSHRPGQPRCHESSRS